MWESRTPVLVTSQFKYSITTGEESSCHVSRISYQVSNLLLPSLEQRIADFVHARSRERWPRQRSLDGFPLTFYGIDLTLIIMSSMKILNYSRGSIQWPTNDTFNSPKTKLTLHFTFKYQGYPNQDEIKTINHNWM